LESSALYEECDRASSQRPSNPLRLGRKIGVDRPHFCPRRRVFARRGPRNSRPRTLTGRLRSSSAVALRPPQGLYQGVEHAGRESERRPAAPEVALGPVEAAEKGALPSTRFGTANKRLLPAFGRGPSGPCAKLTAPSPIGPEEAEALAGDRLKRGVPRPPRASKILAPRRVRSDESAQPILTSSALSPAHAAPRGRADAFRRIRMIAGGATNCLCPTSLLGAHAAHVRQFPLSYPDSLAELWMGVGSSGLERPTRLLSAIAPASLGAGRGGVVVH